MGLRIRGLKIKNFRLFIDEEFDFSEKQAKTELNVIFGGGGCYKTTFVESIG